jgi:hypothetical protein
LEVLPLFFSHRVWGLSIEGHSYLGKAHQSQDASFRDA